MLLGGSAGSSSEVTYNGNPYSFDLHFITSLNPRIDFAQRCFCTFLLNVENQCHQLFFFDIDCVPRVNGSQI